MAKVAIKSEKLSPFGGIFPIMEQFDSKLSSVIDSTLGMRCRLYGYQYSEIIRSLMSVYFCGGSCIEDVTTHLMYHLSLHPTLRTCRLLNRYKTWKHLTESLHYKLLICIFEHYKSMFFTVECIFPIVEYMSCTAERMFCSGEHGIQSIIRQTIDYYAKVFITGDERREEYWEEDSIS